MVIVPDQSQALMLRCVLEKPLVLHLYRNDITPGKIDTARNYEEAQFGGYSPVALSASGWLWDGNRAKYPDQEFLANGNDSELVYGYYVTFKENSLLLWAERFDTGPAAMNVLGDRLTLALRI